MAMTGMKRKPGNPQEHRVNREAAVRERETERQKGSERRKQQREGRISRIGKRINPQLVLTDKKTEENEMAKKGRSLQLRELNLFLQIH